MNLVIDIGNSTIKYAVFQDNACIMHLTADFDSCDELKSILSEYDIDYAIASCVATPPKHFQTILEELPHPLLLLDSSTRLPIEIRYKTPQTLGADNFFLTAYNFSYMRREFFSCAQKIFALCATNNPANG